MYFFIIENGGISIGISLKCVPESPFHKPASLIQLMAWCRRPAHRLIKASSGLNELKNIYFDSNFTDVPLCCRHRIYIGSAYGFSPVRYQAMSTGTQFAVANALSQTLVVANYRCRKLIFWSIYLYKVGSKAIVNFSWQIALSLWKPLVPTMTTILAPWLPLVFNGQCCSLK